VTIPAGNPVGVESTGIFTAAPAGDVVVGISVDLNISGGYNGNLAAYLVAPNGTVVMLMDQPGVSVDGFGASSSGMNLTLSDAGSTSIQSVTGGAGLLTGIYQADQTLGTFNNTVANGAWELYFADLASGGGNPVLNSWSLDLGVTPVPEPVLLALLVFFGLVALHWCLGRFWTAPSQPSTLPSSVAEPLRRTDNPLPSFLHWCQGRFWTVPSSRSNNSTESASSSSSLLPSADRDSR
jgi:subtilisin-like proprotein convertase family protein